MLAMLAMSASSPPSYALHLPFIAPFTRWLADVAERLKPTDNDILLIR